MSDLFVVVEQAEKDQLFWDFNEESEGAEESSRRTIPGRIVQYMYDAIRGRDIAHRSIGLLSTFAARRSLVCWFLYCTDKRPLMVANGLLEFWLHSKCRAHDIDASWLVVAEPMENGSAIADCRWQDTYAASSAVAHAARFAKKQLTIDAITSLSHAHNAFDVSPVGDIDLFERWLIEIAAPCAIEGRAMSKEEEFALAEFEVPDAMRHRR